MSMVSAAQDDDVMAEINITPFTDVLLVLLIIFMILASLVTPPGFQKELPNNDKGVIFVDAQKTDEKSIYYIMSQTAARRGHIHVAITADAKAPYGIIIR